MKRADLIGGVGGDPTDIKIIDRSTGAERTSPEMIVGVR